LGSIDTDKNNWGTHLNRQYYYIKLLKDPNRVINFIKNYDWKNVGNNTVGAPVISKYDIVKTLIDNL